MKLRILATTLVLLGAPAAAQSEARAIASFRRLVASEEATPEDRQAALAALARHDSAKVAAELIRAFIQLEKAAEPIRERRRGALLRGGGSKALQPHRRKLQPIRNLQEEIAKVIRRLRDPAAVTAMLRTLVRGKQPLPLTLRIEIAARAGDLPDDALSLLLEASRAPAKKNSDQRARHALPLLRALRAAGRRAAAAAPFAIRHLAHELLDVRVEAAQALAALCAPASIPALVARAAAEEGRGLEAVFDALTAITGVNPGRSASAWRRWLDQEGGPYVAGKVPLGRQAAGPARPQQPPPSGTGSYFGIPQDGQSILYVFDNSQSMKAAMPGQRKLPAAQQVKRIDRCRQELHRALDQLTPRKTFNILAFANRLRMFAATMQPATKANVSKAHAWIDSLELEFQTNIHDALELSFYLAGRGTVDRYYPLAADTLFFLSDGAPTAPKPTGRGITADSVPEILAAVRRWNPLQRMVIHTIGLGMGQGRNARNNRVSTFMRELAEQNGGRFVVPR